MTRTKLPWRMRIAIALLALLGASSGSFVVFMILITTHVVVYPTDSPGVAFGCGLPFLVHSIASITAAYLIAKRPIPGVILGTSVGVCTGLVLVPVTTCVSFGTLDDPHVLGPAILMAGIFVLHAATAGVCLSCWKLSQTREIARIRALKDKPVTF